jgi:acetyl-CoA carboxylase biotin carboxyl carrier protein
MFEAGLDERDLAEPVAVGPGPDPQTNGAARADGVPDDLMTTAPVAGLAGADASLLALIDRLTGVLERSDLGELEVAAGGTTILLRAPSAIERPIAMTAPAADGAGAAAAPVDGPAGGGSSTTTAAEARPSVKAPLTGLFYAAPSPGAQPYVAVGDHVAVGQIIGLIEAMKLFNEIKSDLAGRVVRLCVETGALVKARQPLIEVEPA